MEMTLSASGMPKRTHLRGTQAYVLAGLFVVLLLALIWIVTLRLIASEHAAARAQCALRSATGSSSG